MNRERVVSVVVAVACIASMGVASTTLESSLASNPDDAIELDYDTLPIGREDAKEVKQDVQQNEENGQPQSQSQSSSASSSSSSSDSSSASASAASSSSEQSLLDTLIALLEALLPYLVGTLVVLAVGGLGYRYRRRLVAPFFALIGGSGGGDGDDERPAVEWQPRDEVERAWLELVQTAGVDRPQSKTPAECADDVVAAGYDPEPVHRLRRAFEDVRYGEQTPTDDLREQVAQSRRRLGLGGKP